MRSPFIINMIVVAVCFLCVFTCSCGDCQSIGDIYAFELLRAPEILIIQWCSLLKKKNVVVVVVLCCCVVFISVKFGLVWFLVWFGKISSKSFHLLTRILIFST